MKKKVSTAVAATVATLTLSATVSAGSLILHNITADPSGWQNLLDTHGQEAAGGWNLDNDPDYGMDFFPGPVTSAGYGGIVLPGTLSDDVTLGGGGGDNMIAIGPDMGFGNVSNALLDFNSIFPIAVNSDGSGPKTAIEFSPIVMSIAGSSTVSISVDGDLLATGVDAFPAGSRWGIIDPTGVGFEEVLLFDPNFVQGAIQPGVQGSGATYATVLPAPGALALLGLAGVAAPRRRQR